MINDRPARPEALDDFRIISELISDFIYAARVAPDSSFAVEWASDLLARITGYTAQEINERGWESIVHPEDLPLFARQMDRLRSGQNSVSEHRIVARGGEIRWIRNYAHPVLDGQNRLVRIYGAVQVITERKLADEQLRESEERFAKAFSANPDPMTIHRMSDGRYVAANDSFLRITGFTRDEIIGRTATELNLFVDEGDRLRWREALRESGCIRNLEALYRTRGGEIRAALLSAEIIDVGGEPCILAVSADITERKRAEEERAQLLKREQALRVEAEQANRLKDEFLATISHELRTPLNAILGWANMLRSGRLDPEITARAVEIIERNARSQAKIVEDLLDISRIITGKLRLNIGPVELSPVIEAALDVIRPAAAAKDIRLEVMLDSHAGPVAGDPERLQQVIWNLLSNAVKFTDKGGRVQTRLRRHNSQVSLTVSDTGQGISPEFLPFVFDRFRQADSGYARAHGGLGLGLAIVRQLVEMHGGSVSASSPGEEQGTTFTVNLPLMITHPAAPASTLPEARDEQAAARGMAFDCPPALVNLHLLVVEDDLDARLLLHVLLKQCEAEVRAAGSVAEAFGVIEEWEPDLLISDIEMPGEDGYSLIQKIRSHDKGELRRLPAIALTAHARGDDRVRALTAGFDAYVAKPFEPSELINVILSLARISGKR
jgi:PAS domain S-box-containing protein